LRNGRIRHYLEIVFKRGIQFVMEMIIFEDLVEEKTAKKTGRERLVR
jgi:hypothetical protein